MYSKRTLKTGRRTCGMTTSCSWLSRMPDVNIARKCGQRAARRAFHRPISSGGGGIVYRNGLGSTEWFRVASFRREGRRDPSAERTVGGGGDGGKSELQGRWFYLQRARKTNLSLMTVLLQAYTYCKDACWHVCPNASANTCALLLLRDVGWCTRQLPPSWITKVGS